MSGPIARLGEIAEAAGASPAWAIDVHAIAAAIAATPPASGAAICAASVVYLMLARINRRRAARGTRLPQATPAPIAVTSDTA